MHSRQPYTLLYVVTDTLSAMGLIVVALSRKRNFPKPNPLFLLQAKFDGMQVNAIAGVGFLNFLTVIFHRLVPQL
ncbi:MAG: hypothetical protein WBA16_07070 [Nonlabens sp.]